MPPKTRKVKRKIVPVNPHALPKPVKKEPVKNPLFEKRTKNFAIGGNIQPRRDLSRYVKWPRYVRLQRQKRILLQRIKVPPAIHQFNQGLKKQTATQLFRLMNKYKPETRKQKKERLRKEAEVIAKGDKKSISTKKPYTVKYGLKHITNLVEQKKAKIVLIAHDVDPIELVVWLPALCRKMGVPYCIVKGKSRLGKVVHTKTATSLAITDVRSEDKANLNTLIDSVMTDYNNRAKEIRENWGGGILGSKSLDRIEKIRRAKEKEMVF